MSNPNDRFKIGDHFLSADGTILWRVTDVGTRVIVAIDISALPADDSNGPPYVIDEVVFDEYDQTGIARCDERGTALEEPPGLAADYLTLPRAYPGRSEAR